MLKHSFTLFVVFALIVGCSQDPYDDKSSYGIDPNFVASQTKFNVVEDDVEDICVYENNYWLACSDSIGLIQHSWFLILEDGSTIHLSNNREQLLTRSGEYIYKRRGAHQGVSYDTVINFELKFCPSYVEFPDVFEPNGDGQFDFWGPVGQGVKLIAFTVFDDKNHPVYEGNSMTDQWDGLISGNKAPMGTYEFRAEGRLESGYRFEYVGLFELLR